MNDTGGRRDLHDSVDRHRRLRERWEREGERSLAQNLAMIGALGWLIVMPTLLGILVGRQADRSFDTGILWTAAMLVVGLTAGCWLAWKRMHLE